MLFKFLHPVLLLLPPEMTHILALAFLKISQWWRFKWRNQSLPKVVFISSIAPVLPKLRGGVGLAAGFDKNAEIFAALGCFGFGFIEVGTVTPRPQPGNPKPRLWRIAPESLINHMGFNNVGLERFRKNILEYRRCVLDVPLFANIGKNSDTPNERAIEDYEVLVNGLKDHVDAFVVNISSPNTPGLFNLQTEAFLEKLSSVLVARRPTFVKLSCDLDNEKLGDLCLQVRENKWLCGVVLTNTSRKIAEALRPLLPGGYSGSRLFERAVECVSLARQSLKSPKLIIGVGGISSRDDARKMKIAGADLIEIYTAFVYRGPGVIAQLGEAFNRRYLKQNGKMEGKSQKKEGSGNDS